MDIEFYYEVKHVLNSVDFRIQTNIHRSGVGGNYSDIDTLSITFDPRSKV